MPKTHKWLQFQTGLPPNYMHKMILWNPHYQPQQYPIWISPHYINAWSSKQQTIQKKFLNTLNYWQPKDHRYVCPTLFIPHLCHTHPIIQHRQWFHHKQTFNTTPPSLCPNSRPWTNLPRFYLTWMIYMVIGMVPHTYCHKYFQPSSTNTYDIAKVVLLSTNQLMKTINTRNLPLMWLQEVA